MVKYKMEIEVRGEWPVRLNSSLLKRVTRTTATRSSATRTDTETCNKVLCFLENPSFRKLVFNYISGKAIIEFFIPVPIF